MVNQFALFTLPLSIAQMAHVSRFKVQFNYLDEMCQFLPISPNTYAHEVIHPTQLDNSNLEHNDIF